MKRWCSYCQVTKTCWPRMPMEVPTSVGRRLVDQPSLSFAFTDAIFDTNEDSHATNEAYLFRAMLQHERFPALFRAIVHATSKHGVRSASLCIACSTLARRPSASASRAHATSTTARSRSARTMWAPKMLNPLNIGVTGDGRSHFPNGRPELDAGYSAHARRNVQHNADIIFKAPRSTNDMKSILQGHHDFPRKPARPADHRELLLLTSCERRQIPRREMIGHRCGHPPIPYY